MERVEVIIYDYKQFNIDYPYVVSRVEDLVEEYRNDKSIAFVSSSNSLLFMDSGSDLGYMKAIKGIEPFVKKALRPLNQVSGLGRPCLYIGDAQLTIPEGTYKFVNAPSMYLPQKVPKTRNPYHTLAAALNVIHNYNRICPDNEKITRVFTPFICTNWGGISGDIALEMMREAIDNVERDFDNYTFRITSDEDNIYHSLSRFRNDILQEQPKIYQNIEFGITIEQYLAHGSHV